MTSTGKFKLNEYRIEELERKHKRIVMCLVTRHRVRLVAGCIGNLNIIIISNYYAITNSHTKSPHSAVSSPVITTDSSASMLHDFGYWSLAFVP